MHPHTRHDFGVMGAARLGHFIFMVRKDQIQPASMNIKRFTKVMLCHGRTFDMPSRTPFASVKRVIPARLVIIAWFPQDKVRRIALVRGHLDPRTSNHVIHTAARQLAIARHGGDAEQHMPLSHIGMAFFDQQRDHGNHLVNEGGGTRLMVRRQRPQCGYIAVKAGDRIVTQLPDINIAFSGTGDDLVINIGDVAHIGHLRIVMTQQTHQHVKYDNRPRIADMNAVIDRWPAGIDAHILCIQRDKRLFLAR